MSQFEHIEQIVMIKALCGGCISLQVLKLSKCSGFSTVGLKSIAQACR